MVDTSNFYWSNKGLYQGAADKLMEKIPSQGAVRGVKNKALERMRKAVNRYYRMYNDGDVTIGTIKVFGLDGVWKYKSYETYVAYNGRMKTRVRYSQEMYNKIEQAMDKIVCDAAMEQGVAL